MDDCKEFGGVTREKLDNLKQTMRNNGMTPPDGDSGVVEAMGVKVSLAYNAANQNLKICIIERPAFVPAAMVWAQIENSLK